MSARLDTAIFMALPGAIVFTALAHGTVEPWSVAVFQLLVIGMAVAWGAKSLAERRLTAVVPIASLPIAFVLLVGLAQSIALTDASGRISSLSADVEATRSALAQFAALAVAFLLAANFLAGADRLRRTTMFLVVYGFALAVFALVQHVAWDGRFYWLRPAPVAASPFGPFVNRNHFAGYMEMLVPIPVGLLAARGAGESWPFHVLAATAMGVAAVASLSRGGLISLAASLAFVCVMSLRREPGRRAALAAPVLAVALAIVLGVLWIGPGPLLGRFASTWLVDASPEAETFFASRGVIWRDVLSMIGDNPVLGAGFGAFETAFPLYRRPDPSPVFDSATVVPQAHNDYLQIVADCGFAGGLAALWFVAILLRAIFAAMRAPDPFLGGLALGCGGGLVAMLVHSAFDFNLQIPSNALLFLVLVAIVSRLQENAECGMRNAE